MTKVVWPTNGDVSAGDPASSWMDDLHRRDCWTARLWGHAHRCFNIVTLSIALGTKTNQIPSLSFICILIVPFRYCYCYNANTPTHLAPVSVSDELKLLTRESDRRKTSNTNCGTATTFGFIWFHYVSFNFVCFMSVKIVVSVCFRVKIATGSPLAQTDPNAQRWSKRLPRTDCAPSPPGCALDCFQDFSGMNHNWATQIHWLPCQQVSLKILSHQVWKPKCHLSSFFTPCEAFIRPDDKSHPFPGTSTQSSFPPQT